MHDAVRAIRAYQAPDEVTKTVDVRVEAALDAFIGDMSQDDDILRMQNASELIRLVSDKSAVSHELSLTRKEAEMLANKVAFLETVVEHADDAHSREIEALKCSFGDDEETLATRVAVCKAKAFHAWRFGTSEIAMHFSKAQNVFAHTPLASHVAHTGAP